MTKRFFNLSSFFFFYFWVIGVWVIFLPKILSEMGYSSFEIGVVLSIPPLMRFLTPFLFLRLFSLDKRTLRVSIWMMLLSLPLLYLTIESFWAFAIANIFFGFAFSLVLPFIESYALRVLQKEKYGKSRLFGSIGFMLVALVLARVFTGNIGLHFIAFGVVVAAYFAFVISHEDSETAVPSTQKADISILTSNIPLWGSVFLMQVGFGAFYSFFTLYENGHGVSLESVSYLWSFGVICEIVLFYFQEYIIKFDLMKLIKFSIFITAVRWLILYLFPSSLPLAYLSQSFHAFSFALYHTASISYIYQKFEDKKLANQFYYGFGFGLGGFIGSLVAGYFYGESLFLSASVITMGALLVLMRVKRKQL